VNPQIIAHRGWSHAYPENTAVSFDAALTLPVDGLELDIQCSKDGVPVIYHDRTLSKLGFPRKTIAQRTWKELRSLDAGSWFSKRFSNESLLTLDALLKRYASKTTLCLEIKARGEESWKQKTVRAVVECVKKNCSAARVLFLCFQETILEEVLKQDPNARCVWNLEKRPVLKASFFKKIFPFFALCFDVRCLTPSLVKTLHQKNKKVFTYTCNTKTMLHKAIRCGVDAVLSDKPDWALQRLKIPT
jgi:glycerophosphoryl diester phosphodiesterase